MLHQDVRDITQGHSVLIIGQNRAIKIRKDANHFSIFIYDSYFS